MNVTPVKTQCQICARCDSNLTRDKSIRKQETARFTANIGKVNNFLIYIFVQKSREKYFRVFAGAFSGICHYFLVESNLYISTILVISFLSHVPGNSGAILKMQPSQAIGLVM